MLNSVKLRTFTTLVIKNLIGIFMCFLVITPILITLFASVKTRGALATTSPLLLPPFENISFENYEIVLRDKKFLIGAKNSALIVVISIFFNVFFGSVTAYCLERFQFKFRKVIFALFFLGMMVPSFVTEIARFKIIQGLGLYNTLAAPIVIYIASDLMQLYIYRQFISKISTSIDESALVDGCSYFRVFWQIVFPLMAPATATVIIIKAINIINDMYIPYLYMPSNKLKTITTFLMIFSNAQKGSWQKLAAAVILVLIPTIAIYLIFQKHIISGLAAGAVKE